MIQKILSASAILAFAATSVASAQPTVQGSTTVLATLTVPTTCIITTFPNNFSFGSVALAAPGTVTPVELQVTYAGCGTSSTLNVTDGKTAVTGSPASAGYNYTLTGTNSSSNLAYFGVEAAPAGTNIFTGGSALGNVSPTVSGYSLTSGSGTLALVAQLLNSTITASDSYSDSLTVGVAF